MGGERVAAGLERIGGFAFVHKQGGLCFAHGEAGAVLDFLVGHGEAPHQQPFFGIRPFDNVDKLLLDEIAQHGDSFLDG